MQAEVAEDGESEEGEEEGEVDKEGDKEEVKGQGTEEEGNNGEGE